MNLLARWGRFAADCFLKKVLSKKPNVRFATRLASREQSFEPYLKALTLRRGPRHDVSYQQSSLEQREARRPEAAAQTRTNMGYPYSVRDSKEHPRAGDVQHGN